MRQVIKTLYKGQVAVADKFVYRCLEKKEPLIVVHGSQTMTLDPDYLEHQIEQITGPYRDRRGGGDYQLVYYSWKPNQAKLF